MEERPRLFYAEAEKMDRPEREASAVHAAQSVVLSPVRDSHESIALEGALIVVVHAAPNWFGLRGEAGLAISEMHVRVGGREVKEALAAGLLALAPLSQRLPENESPATYLSWAAVLAGTPAAASRDLGARFGIASFFDKPLRSAPPHVRHAVCIASAFLSGAPTLVVEDPLDGLPVDVAEEFTRVLLSALSSRSVVWLAPRLSLATALATSCSEAVWFHGSHCLRRGKPSAEAEGADTSVLSVRGPSDAFAERLSADGVEVSAISHDTQTSTWLVRTRETWRIFAAASDVGATVTELRPLLSP